MKTPRIGAAVLVVHEDKVLLGKRNKTNAYGKWVIPGGGVDFGESLEQAAIRELKEETNIDITNLSFLRFKEIIFPDHDYHRIVFFYKAKPTSFDLIARDDLDKVQFFTKKELTKLNLVDSAEVILKEEGYL
jgi:ADP-ribose pyrophosphatase YjhB (NUDIX family)